MTCERLLSFTDWTIDNFHLYQLKVSYWSNCVIHEGRFFTLHQIYIFPFKDSIKVVGCAGEATKP